MPEINHQVYIKESIARVFDTLTTAEGWNAWFTDQTSIHQESDGTGEIRLRWTGLGKDKKDLVDGGKILQTIPNKSFIFQWTPGESVTTIEFKLEPYRDGTLVVFKETGYSNSDNDIKACLNCAVGWGETLTLLKVYLEEALVYKEESKEIQQC